MVRITELENAELKKVKVHFERNRSYKGLKKDPESNKWKYVIERCERKMSNHCNSGFCIKAKTRFCHLFDEQSRKDIFKKFWQMSWDMKKIYVSSLIDIISPKEKKGENEMSRRGFTYNYFLFKAKSRMQV